MTPIELRGGIFRATVSHSRCTLHELLDSIGLTAWQIRVLRVRDLSELCLSRGSPTLRVTLRLLTLVGDLARIYFLGGPVFGNGPCCGAWQIVLLLCGISGCLTATIGYAFSLLWQELWQVHCLWEYDVVLVELNTASTACSVSDVPINF